ncbi:MAG: hypothetical protein P4L53_04675 [Candidatus Obscuribacterales bacterium]|nr:hypothetical protein [Candidatus Obscuribacterales bacterium]
MNKFRNLEEYEMETLFERLEHRFQFVHNHYPLIATAMLVGVGVEHIGLAMYRSDVFPIWFALVMLAIHLTAAFWVSSNAANFRSALAQARHVRHKRTPPLPW